MTPQAQARKDHERLLRDIQVHGDPDEVAMATAIIEGKRYGPVGDGFFWDFYLAPVEGNA